MIHRLAITAAIGTAATARRADHRHSQASSTAAGGPVALANYTTPWTTKQGHVPTGSGNHHHHSGLFDPLGGLHGDHGPHGHHGHHHGGGPGDGP
jgi:hypothetical protein